LPSAPAVAGSAGSMPAEAEAFVRLLLSEKGMMMFERAGFYRFKELRIAGDESAVPQSIRALIKGSVCPYAKTK